MNEYLIYALIGFGLLLVALIIPGVKVLAEALLKLLMEFTVELVKHKGTFLIWGVKKLAQDHVRLLAHALKTRDDIDPTQKIRRKAEGYDS